MTRDAFALIINSVAATYNLTLAAGFGWRAGLTAVCAALSAGVVGWLLGRTKETAP